MDISSSRSDIFKDEWTTLLKAVADLEIAQKAGNFSRDSKESLL